MVIKMITAYQDPKLIKKILVVDDNKMNLAVAKEALSNDYSVLCTTAADKMFSLLEKFIPDLILLDIEMPGMTGIEALKQLRAYEDPNIKNVRVVFLTSHGSDSNVVNAHKYKAHGFILKPFDPATLRKKITDLIG